MSLHEGERKESKMAVIMKAQYLAKYTIQVCSNTKIFVPLYDKAITQKIIDIATDIYIDCFTANETMVRANTPDYEDNKVKRRKLQNRARNNCNKLLALIELAQPIKEILMIC